MFPPLSFSTRWCAGNLAVWQRLDRNVEVKWTGDVQQRTSPVPDWKWGWWKQRAGWHRHEEHLRTLRGGGGGWWGSGTENCSWMSELLFFFLFVTDAHVRSSSISQSVWLWWGSAPWWRNRNPNQWLRFWRGSVSLSTSLWSFFQRRLYSMNRWRSGHCVTASFPSIPKVSDITQFTHNQIQSDWNLDVLYCLSIINVAFKTEINYN